MLVTLGAVVAALLVIVACAAVVGRAWIYMAWRSIAPPQIFADKDRLHQCRESFKLRSARDFIVETPVMALFGFAAPVSPDYCLALFLCGMKTRTGLTLAERKAVCGLVPSKYQDMFERVKGGT